MVPSIDMTAFILSVVHGVILAGVLMGLIRLRHQMLFSKVNIFLVSLFALFLFVDGIVSGPYSASVGLVSGGALSIALVRLYANRHQTRNHASE